MWIGQVELPQELIDAHRAGDLVIFVGAGASIASPADLPDFKKLSDEIAKDARVVVEAGEQPDVVLGNADADKLMDVHRRIATRIGDPASKPNVLHEAIVRLARAGRTTRIVTTNYDRHLSTVLGDGPPEYRGPVLPLGDDFDGLVYLHGTLEQEPRHLVATDQDFGTAYLLDGWAVRFLVPMFREYTVLFVGYSHNDFAMTYLGRALPPTSRRYALAEDTPEQKQHWRRLGITAVLYPNPDRDHSALPALIGKWAERAEMRLLDHRQMVARLVAGPPSGVPEEISYLEDVLGSDDKVRFFTEYARGPQWLAWVTEQPRFRQLFDGSAVGSPLAEWFAQHFVAEEEHTRAAFEAVEACGGRLGFRVWSAIGQRLHIIGAPRPAWLTRWVVLLIRDDPREGADWLEYALKASRLPADRDTLLLLFTHLTTPTVDFRQPRRPRLPSSVELNIRGDLEWLRRAWEETIVPALEGVARELLAISDVHLRQAYRLSDATAGSPGWDSLSRGRMAIERHPQNSFRKHGGGQSALGRRLRQRRIPRFPQRRDPVAHAHSPDPRRRALVHLLAGPVRGDLAFGRHRRVSREAATSAGQCSLPWA
ncbi:SIR2 family protein [Actinoplanes aureus]|uniref:SIR2 family protein n=1 Tax=Actinoplanes aureus TaxID=2792083 RepID=A0A931G198_9ACTN|nr:SIR2 family protein [Actinoplanes aureus]MBG0564916.1 SIR2 family protein [Actinoplanes aureus]